MMIVVNIWQLFWVTDRHFFFFLNTDELKAMLTAALEEAENAKIELVMRKRLSFHWKNHECQELFSLKFFIVVDCDVIILFVDIQASKKRLLNAEEKEIFAPNVAKKCFLICVLTPL